jgi:hypothetical protein
MMALFQHEDRLNPAFNEGNKGDKDLKAPSSSSITLLPLQQHHFHSLQSSKMTPKTCSPEVMKGSLDSSIKKTLSKVQKLLKRTSSTPPFHSEGSLDLNHDISAITDPCNTCSRDPVMDLEAARREQYLKKLNPRLQLITVMVQYERFTSRFTPFAWIKDEAIDLLAWKSASNTVVFLLFSTTLCLNPILAIALPFLLIWYHSLQLYSLAPMSDRARSKVNNQSSGRTVPRLTLKQNKIALQNIQNILGYISDVYDLFDRLISYFDWSDERTTRLAIYCSAATFLSAIVLFSHFPLNVVILLAVSALFLFTSPLFQAFAMQFSFNKVLDLAIEWFQNYNLENILILFQERSIYFFLVKSKDP